MDWLTDGIGDWIKQGLIDGIIGFFTGMFNDINSQVGEIAANVGMTPGEWNPGVFSMIRTLSNTAVVPIAGMILTFVLTYELIQMIIEKNNMHDFEIYNLYKWMMKACIAVYLLTHTFDIVVGIFSVAQHVVNSSAGIISGSLNLDPSSALADMRTMLEGMGVWELMGLWLEVSIASLGLTALTICIFIVIFGRMVEIFLTISVAPIPLATMANHEWGQIGNNYLKSLFAVAFQGFLIMVCVAIYAVLVQSIPSADNVHLAIFGTLAYTVLLCFMLFRTASLSKSIFSAH